MNIKSVTGRTIFVKILNLGDAYGRNKCCTWDGWGFDKQEKGVEFYDATYAGTKDFDLEGQFVSRYYLGTLLEGQNTGLILHGGIPEWNISAEEMAKVREWLNS